ncbi:hypothetical protein A2W14_07480 [Candidatus Gottesmanbacteria bacterium RBG_16_37_8]|uniref:Uncharacterized protein n=1 Tax=Candidatus Gottesmanbacteria bacterium RBG_16_37_8 TaxID=1798371 RepID=A0A1F5YT67_9BACT|nr:MAG: hypothetical protein A2W14_07480 [Candidatus Gottesmanbacteria bacterium RBG_16_37_8]
MEKRVINLYIFILGIIFFVLSFAWVEISKVMSTIIGITGLLLITISILKKNITIPIEPLELKNEDTNKVKKEEKKAHSIINLFLIFLFWWVGISIVLGTILSFFGIREGIAGPIGFIFGIYKVYQTYNKK